MQKEILFRADGNSEIGLGHLYRLFSLIEMLKEHFQFTFVSSENSTVNIIPNSYQLKIIPSQITIKEEPEWISKEFDKNNTLLIADGYQFNSSYQRKIKGKGFKFVYIDDLASEHMFADLIINHSPNITSQIYSAEPYTKFALGTKYALLRPTFLDLIAKEKTVQKIDKAFVCFGGADPYNLTLKATKALLKTPQVKKIDIVLGGAYSHKEIYTLTQKNIKIYQNISEEELMKTMVTSNFAIAPASTILYELCCVKIPVLSGYYVNNQKKIYNGFANKKAIFEMGNMKDFSINSFEEQIQLFFKIDFQELINRQKKIFDQNIKNRFCKLISSL
jgi:UDP-2,4-diacetamido-2,4,6-trideoxy-beta-L-altropyranose hydrolase